LLNNFVYGFNDGLRHETASALVEVHHSIKSVYYAVVTVRW